MIVITIDGFFLQKSLKIIRRIRIYKNIYFGWLPNFNGVFQIDLVKKTRIYNFQNSKVLIPISSITFFDLVYT